MAESKQYRNVTGIVQFPPRDGEAGGKAVRNITVRQTGFGPTAVRVSATLWPSHAGIEIEEGDVVNFEGAYTKNEKTNDDGKKVVFHNIAVNRIAVLGKADAGSKTETSNTSSAAEEVEDEDIPF